jgi:FtsZ-binding cell division protein ZapB
VVILEQLRESHRLLVMAGMPEAYAVLEAINEIQFLRGAVERLHDELLAKGACEEKNQFLQARVKLLQTERDALREELRGIDEEILSAAGRLGIDISPSAVRAHVARKAQRA